MPITFHNPPDMPDSDKPRLTASEIRFAKTSTAALKEFGEKIDWYRDQMDATYEQYRQAGTLPAPVSRRPRNEDPYDLIRQRAQLLIQRYAQLQPSLQMFTSNISQGIEHTLTDQAYRIDLKIKLADLEGNIQYTRDYLENYFRLFI